MGDDNGDRKAKKKKDLIKSTKATEWSKLDAKCLINGGTTNMKMTEIFLQKLACCFIQILNS